MTSSRTVACLLAASHLRCALSFATSAPTFCTQPPWVFARGVQQRGGSSGRVAARRASTSPGASVTGELWPAPEGAPTLTLFTKEGCTLCDKVVGRQ